MGIDSSFAFPFEFLLSLAILYISFSNWKTPLRIFVGCCWRVKLAFTKGHANGSYKLHSYMFSYYTMESGLINGRNHYTSTDGRFAIAFCGDSW